MACTHVAARASEQRFNLLSERWRDWVGGVLHPHGDTVGLSSETDQDLGRAITHGVN